MAGFISTIIVYGSLIALAFRIGCALELLFFCIPLQIKEAHVCNGLRLLRIQLLFMGIILFITNAITMWFLWTIINAHTHQAFINSLLQVINGIAYFAIAVVGYSMYHRQYTDENKELHEKVSRLEHEQ